MKPYNECTFEERKIRDGYNKMIVDGEVVWVSSVVLNNSCTMPFDLLKEIVEFVSDKQDCMQFDKTSYGGNRIVAEKYTSESGHTYLRWIWNPHD